VPADHRVQDIFDRVAARYQDRSAVFMELLQRFCPDLVHVGDIRDRVELTMGA
tara:strand:- start:338 stop:496 length:159 start_codon:yes stop_codon:yes gene_type:complete